MTDKEPIRCQDCEHHKCYYGADGQDCSCALSVFVTPTTNKPPSNCPLLYSGLLKEKIEPSKTEQKLPPRIYNPITGKYYPVRQKITSKGKAGQIKGLWSVKEHRVEVIKE